MWSTTRSLERSPLRRLRCARSTRYWVDGTKLRRPRKQCSTFHGRGRREGGGRRASVCGYGATLADTILRGASLHDDFGTLVVADVANPGDLPTLRAELVQDFGQLRAERLLQIARRVPHDAARNVHSIAAREDLIFELVHRASSRASQ